MSCNYPIWRTTKFGLNIPTPCGCCLGCRNDRREQFTQRLQLEFQTSNYIGSFITLTYRDEELPKLLPENSAISGDFFKGRTPAGTLYKPDLTSFRDKLNHRIKYKYAHSIKYVLVGEYGSESEQPRPHYHGIIIGLPSGDRKLLYDTWNKGKIDIQPVSHATIRYTLKYIDKQIFGFDSLYQAFGDYYPPFAFFSNGIGDKFFQQNKDKFTKYGEYYFSDTKKYKLNPYYRDKYGFKPSYTMFGKDVLDFAKANKIKNLLTAQEKLCKLREQNILSKEHSKGIPVHSVILEPQDRLDISIKDLAENVINSLDKSN